MHWKIIDYPEAVVVELRSNSVNRQNPEYYADLHRAFDTLDREFPHKPAILTASGKVFSAGIDFSYVFPILSQGDPAEVQRWFDDYKRSMMRVFTSPRLLIAALNGHAFAGGMVLAMCCDYRFAVTGDYKFALNEVPVGIPMPSLYTEIIRLRMGERGANQAILFGKTYDVEAAHRLGLVDEVTYPDGLLDNARALAAKIPEDCWKVCAQTKLNLIAPTAKRIESDCPAWDKQTLKVIVSPEAIRAQRLTYEALKSRRG